MTTNTGISTIRFRWFREAMSMISDRWPDPDLMDLEVIQRKCDELEELVQEFMAEAKKICEDLEQCAEKCKTEAQQAAAEAEKFMKEKNELRAAWCMRRSEMKMAMGKQYYHVATLVENKAEWLRIYTDKTRVMDWLRNNEYNLTANPDNVDMKAAAVAETKEIQRNKERIQHMEEEIERDMSVIENNAFAGSQEDDKAILLRLKQLTKARRSSEKKQHSVSTKTVATEPRQKQAVAMTTQSKPVAMGMKR